MANYEEEEKDIEVPSGTGVPGLLRTVAAVLNLPRVQSVIITPGYVVYRRLKKPDEGEQALGLELESLLPSHVVRSKPVYEISSAHTNAAVVISQMFAQASVDGYTPVAFVGHGCSRLWDWFTSTTSLVVPHDDFYGLPFLTDSDIPEETVLLCAALGRKGTMADVVKSYKITVPLQRKKKDEPKTG